MRRLLCLVCLCFCVSSVGCFKFLDDLRRDDGHISKIGASARARQVEGDVDWGTSF